MTIQLIEGGIPREIRVRDFVCYTLGWRGHFLVARLMNGARTTFFPDNGSFRVL